MRLLITTFLTMRCSFMTVHKGLKCSCAVGHVFLYLFHWWEKCFQAIAASPWSLGLRMNPCSVDCGLEFKYSKLLIPTGPATGSLGTHPSLPYMLTHRACIMEGHWDAVLCCFPVITETVNTTMVVTEHMMFLMCFRKPCSLVVLSSGSTVMKYQSYTILSN